MAEHSSFVNSCCPARRGPPLIVSGSDDGTAKLWDMRHRGCLQTFPDKYQVSTSSMIMKLVSEDFLTVSQCQDCSQNCWVTSGANLNCCGTYSATYGYVWSFSNMYRKKVLITPEALS